MLFKLEKENGIYQVSENGRKVYTMENHGNGQNVIITLKNIYENDIMSIQEDKKWYQLFKKVRSYKIMEGTTQIGRLHKHKDGYELILHDVAYCLFGGTYEAKQIVVLFDNANQIADFTLNQDAYVTFSDGVLGSVYAMLLYMLKEVIQQEDFSDKAFKKHYKGTYIRGLHDFAPE